MKSVQRHPASEQGFSMAELLVVVAVVAILASLAAPSFRSLIADQRIKAAAGELHATLTLARSEAMKRSVNVTVAPKSSSWVNGWQIADPSNIDVLLEDHPAVNGVSITGGPASVVYQSVGRISAGSAVNFTLSSTSTSTQRCVSIELSGRPTVKSC